MLVNILALWYSRMWHVTSCSLVNSYQHCRGTYWLHLQVGKSTSLLLHWRGSNFFQNIGNHRPEYSFTSQKAVPIIQNSSWENEFIIVFLGPWMPNANQPLCAIAAPAWFHISLYLYSHFPSSTWKVKAANSATRIHIITSLKIGKVMLSLCLMLKFLLNKIWCHKIHFTEVVHTFQEKKITLFTTKCKFSNYTSNTTADRNKWWCNLTLAGKYWCVCVDLFETFDYLIWTLCVFYIFHFFMWKFQLYCTLLCFCSSWGTMLQAGRSQVRLNSIGLVIPATLWPWGWLSL
jgi:hypothetical protein